MRLVKLTSQIAAFQKRQNGDGPAPHAVVKAAVQFGGTRDSIGSDRPGIESNIAGGKPQIRVMVIVIRQRELFEIVAALTSSC